MFKIKIIVLVVLISCVILFAGGPSNQADFAPEQQQKIIKVQPVIIQDNAATELVKWAGGAATTMLGVWLAYHLNSKRKVKRNKKK